MTGSDKQVAWAKDLKANLDTAFVIIRSARASKNHSSNPTLAKLAHVDLDALETAISYRVASSWWIDAMRAARTVVVPAKDCWCEVTTINDIDKWMTDDANNAIGVAFDVLRLAASALK